MDNLLPGSINTEDLRILEQVVEERLAEIPLDKLLLYILETCDAQALPFLARQFNVLGNRGWRWADTEQKQRDLLKRAIKMQRKEGTEFSVKESLKVIGINNVEILHPIPGNQYNGQWSFNGTITYGGAYHWACFKVLVDTEELANLEPDVVEIAVELINEWKNVRSRLIAVEAAAFIEDSVEVTDELDFDIEFDFDEQVGPIKYDGSANFDGSATYNGTYDELEINDSTMATIFKVLGTPTEGNKIDVTIVINSSYLGVELEFQLPDGTVDSRTAGNTEAVTYNFTGTETLGFIMRVADAAAIKTITIGNSYPESIEFIDQCAPGDFFCNATPLSSVLNIGAILDGQDIIIDLTANTLPTSAVNAILADIVSAAGFVAGGSAIDLSLQTPPAPPSGAGITDKATIAATWAAITTD